MRSQLNQFNLGTLVERYLLLDALLFRLNIIPDRAAVWPYQKTVQID